MKKSILLIISNMESGGVSKSMSSLLNVIDTEKYDVDCFILSPQGVFMPFILKDIHLITDERTALLCRDFPKNIPLLLRKGFLVDAFIRTLAGFFMLFNKGIGGWLISRRIKKLPKEYDLAVDYNGQHQLYYLIDKVKAKKKVTFFHSDYAKWDYYYSMDKKYMPKADRIFTISNLCVNSLISYFPGCESRIGLFENISSVATIEQMAGEQVEDPLRFEGLKLITLGHLTENKGTDLAIRAAKILKDRKLNFRWYFVGQNQNPQLFEKMLAENQVEEEVVLLGLKPNPYPYIKQADILVHPSRFEGKSIALDEAKILCKPIVVTNFSTVNDQFINRVNASICEMNPEDIAEEIIELHTDSELRAAYISYLAQHQKSNESEVEKLYRLL